METVLIVFLIIYVIAIAAEAIHDHYEETNIYYWKDSLVNISLGILGVSVRLAAKGLWLAIWFYVYKFAFFDIPRTIFTWVVLFFLNELVYYWFHRISHENRFFWAVHVNHHSSEKFNFSVSARIPFLNSVYDNIFWLILPLIGFDPTMVFAVETVSFLFAFFQHTQLVKKLPKPIEFIFNTPSHHRVHHATNPVYINKNYGNVLIIYDRLFRSFQEEIDSVAPVYGITNNVNSYNIVTVIFHEWRDMIREYILKRKRSKQKNKT